MQSFIVPCLPAQNATSIDAQVAQLRVLELFRADFLGRFPSGVVLSELEYMGKTTYASTPAFRIAPGGAAPANGPVQFQGRALINSFLSAMSDSFRKFKAEGDFRKCDVIGLAETGSAQLTIELLEVTTEKNQRSAFKQIADKIDTLTRTVLPSLDFSMKADIQPASWRPVGLQNEYPTAPGTGATTIARWICYLPTQTVPPGAGVILYEVHSIGDKQKVAVPALDKDVATHLKNAFDQRQSLSDDEWIRAYFIANPRDRQTLKVYAASAGLAMAALCVFTILDPVPGDEVPVCVIAARIVGLAVAAGG